MAGKRHLIHSQNWLNSAEKLHRKRNHTGTFWGRGQRGTSVKRSEGTLKDISSRGVLKYPSVPKDGLGDFSSTKRGSEGTSLENILKIELSRKQFWAVLTEKLIESQFWRWKICHALPHIFWRGQVDWGASFPVLSSVCKLHSIFLVKNRTFLVNLQSWDGDTCLRLRCYECYESRSSVLILYEAICKNVVKSHPLFHTPSKFHHAAFWKWYQIIICIKLDL